MKLFLEPLEGYLRRYHSLLVSTEVLLGQLGEGVSGVVAERVEVWQALRMVEELRAAGIVDADLAGNAR